MGDWVDPLKKLINDHGSASEYLENFKMVDFLRREEPLSQIKVIREFFEVGVTDHFKFEEEVVFPVILAKCATIESTKLIWELQKEHVAILKDAEEFQKITSGNAIPLDKERTEAANALARKMINSVLQHSSKEDEKLLPIMKKNIQIFDKQDII
jgi:iron-sulfur cluster repair protein YtfE (RIC family)